VNFFLLFICFERYVKKKEYKTFKGMLTKQLANGEKKQKAKNQ